MKAKKEEKKRDGQKVPKKPLAKKGGANERRGGKGRKGKKMKGDSPTKGGFGGLGKGRGKGGS